MSLLWSAFVSQVLSWSPGWDACHGFSPRGDTHMLAREARLVCWPAGCTCHRTFPAHGPESEWEGSKSSGRSPILFPLGTVPGRDSPTLTLCSSWLVTWHGRMPSLAGPRARRDQSSVRPCPWALSGRRGGTGWRAPAGSSPGPSCAAGLANPRLTGDRFPLQAVP